MTDVHAKLSPSGASRKSAPDPTYLRERLSYDAETGVLVWRYWPPFTKSWNTRYAGTVAGQLKTSDGYCQLAVDGIRFPAHRIAWAIAYGAWPEGEVDHIDGVRRNNSLANLRVVDHHTNTRNAAMNSRNTSGCAGVSWDAANNKWQAAIHVRRRKIHLGRYSEFSEAVRARKAAEREYDFHPNHGRAQVTEASV